MYNCKNYYNYTGHNFLPRKFFYLESLYPLYQFVWGYFMPSDLGNCTTWPQMKKKLERNYVRMLHAILSKSGNYHPAKQQLYCHLPPISQTIPVRQARHAWHCWGSKDEVISDIPQWTTTYERNTVGRLAKTYIHLHCASNRCCLGDLSSTMTNRDGWQKRESQGSSCCHHTMMMMMIKEKENWIKTSSTPLKNCVTSYLWRRGWVKMY